MFGPVQATADVNQQISYFYNVSKFSSIRTLQEQFKINLKHNFNLYNIVLNPLFCNGSTVL